jgi:glutamine synthetase
MSERKTMNFNDLEQWLNERRVTEVECLVPDLTGVARGKILPRAKFTEDRGMRLPQAIVAMGVTGEFPESGPYYDVIDPTDKDMQLRPDPSSVRIVPWATDPTAQVIHDCFDHAGKLVPFAPRSVLRKVCDLFAAEGLQPIVAPELEFYLTARNTDPNTLLKAPIGRSGRAETSRQAYSIDAVNEFDPLFEEIYDYSDKMELNVDTLIHEVGAGQMEINFFHNKPLGLADEVFCVKRRCATTCMPPSWPNPSQANPAAPCTYTKVWSTSPPATTCSATKTARRRRCSCTILVDCSVTYRLQWCWWRPMSTATGA